MSFYDVISELNINLENRLFTVCKGDHAGESGIQIFRTACFFSLFFQIDINMPPVDGSHALVAKTIGPGEIYVFAAADAVGAHWEQQL